MAASETTTILSLNDLAVVQDCVLNLNLPDITELVAYEAANKTDENEDFRLVECVPSAKSYSCPICGRECIKQGFTSRPRVVHDTPIGNLKIMLRLFVPRFKCKECDSVFSYEFSSVAPNSKFTERARINIQRRAFEEPFKYIASQYGIAESTVGDLFDEYAEELEKKRGAVVCPEVLGIDEKHIARHARAVFIDDNTSALIELGEDNSQATIINTIKSFEGYDTNLRLITMDMASDYRSWLKKEFPDVKIVVDHFHVIQDLRRHISKCRTRIISHLNGQMAMLPDSPGKDKKAKLLHNFSTSLSLFRYSKDKLCAIPEMPINPQDPDSDLVPGTPKLVKLMAICKEFPEVAHLYNIKSALEKMYECTDRASAETLLNAWAELIPPEKREDIVKWEATYCVPATLYKPMRTMLNAMRMWQNEVLQYFEPGCRYTNAAAEGQNRMIGAILTQSSGYSFKRLRSKALFWHFASPAAKISYREDKTTRARPYSGSTDTSMFARVTVTNMFEQVTQITVLPFEEEEPKPRKPLSGWHYLWRKEYESPYYFSCESEEDVEKAVNE